MTILGYIVVSYVVLVSLVVLLVIVGRYKIKEVEDELWHKWEDLASYESVRDLRRRVKTLEEEVIRLKGDNTVTIEPDADLAHSTLRFGKYADS